MGYNRQEYRKAQRVLWGEAGEWAADRFDELNDAYFDSQLRTAGVVWGLTPHGGRLGHTHASGRITLHPALLDPKADAWRNEPFLGDRFAEDVLLHEMVHVKLHAEGRDTRGSDDSSHNTEPWCEEVVRLAPRLGLGEVQAAPGETPSHRRRGEAPAARRPPDPGGDRHLPVRAAPGRLLRPQRPPTRADLTAIYWDFL